MPRKRFPGHALLGRAPEGSPGRPPGPGSPDTLPDERRSGSPGTPPNGSPDTPRKRSPTGPPPTTARVLVVDDGPTVAEVVAGHLDRAGYIVDRADDGPTRSPGPPRTGRTWWCWT
ncbi:response regulator [Streptomyces thinghirensis]|nr:response regulator [Streptomyces thinghirensis]